MFENLQVGQGLLIFVFGMMFSSVSLWYCLREYRITKEILKRSGPVSKEEWEKWKH